MKSADDIVERALELLDEVVLEFTETISSELSVQDLAHKILPQVAQNLIKALPFQSKQWLGVDGSVTPTIATTDIDFVKQKVLIECPPDFFEIVSVKLNSWDRAATTYIPFDNQEYNKQINPFTRAGSHSPVVALSETKAPFTSNNVLELYSIEKGTVPIIEHFKYVTTDNIPTDTNLWDDRVFDEITRALSTEINIIKDRIQKSEITQEATEKVIEQYE